MIGFWCTSESAEAWGRMNAALMAEGYRETADDDLEFAESILPLVVEALALAEEGP